MIMRKDYDYDYDYEKSVSAFIELISDSMPS